MFALALVSNLWWNRHCADLRARGQRNSCSAAPNVHRTTVFGRTRHEGSFLWLLSAPLCCFFLFTLQNQSRDFFYDTSHEQCDLGVREPGFKDLTAGSFCWRYIWRHRLMLDNKALAPFDQKRSVGGCVRGPWARSSDNDILAIGGTFSVLQFQRRSVVTVLWLLQLINAIYFPTLGNMLKVIPFTLMLLKGLNCLWPRNYHNCDLFLPVYVHSTIFLVVGSSLYAFHLFTIFQYNRIW